MRNTISQHHESFDVEEARYPDVWHELLIKFKTIEYASRGIEFFAGKKCGGRSAGETYRKRVRCSDKREWESVKDCAEEIGMTARGVRLAIRYGRPIKSGLRFEFVNVRAYRRRAMNGIRL